MRIVLLGDSHLARVRRRLDVIGADVLNAAVGGASVRALGAQAVTAGLRSDDTVVVSVGTNDAAPWKQVPLADFSTLLSEWVRSIDVDGWVYVAQPGVDESRLTGPGDRTNQVIDSYRAAAIEVFGSAGARVVHADRLLAPLGPAAFVDDGLHLTGRAYDLLLPAIAAAVCTAPSAPGGGQADVVEDLEAAGDLGQPDGDV